MKHSIRTKLFLLFAGVLAFFLLGGTLVSELFLQRYYISENRAQFAETAAQIETLLPDKARLQALIEEIDRTQTVSVAVAAADETLEYTSYPRKSADGGRLPKELSALLARGGDAVYGKVSAGDGAAAKIAYAARTRTGEWIVLTKQLRGVTESAAIANRFFLFTALAALLLGGIVVYLFSGRIVRPVLEMNGVAKSISELRFARVETVGRGDELGELAESINVISEKLEASINSLKKDVAYQKQLTRDTSHELKTPIGVIKGYAEGLLYGVADSPEAIDDYCRTIVTECDRMDGLVRDMLELSALEARDAAAQKTCFAAGELLRDVLDSFAPLLDENGVRRSFEADENLVACGDYALLKRALGNFLTNAVRYGDDKRYVRLSARRDGERVRFAVYNSGEGLPAAELSRVWDMFYKVDKARTRQDGGHGLGLAIVRSIAALHGGAAGAENQQGGIEFFISV